MHPLRTGPATTSILLMSLLLYSGLVASQPGDLATSLRDCLALTDNLSRLTCYDDLARQQAVPEAPPPAMPVPVVAAEPESPAPAPDHASVTETPAAETPRTPVAAFGQPTARVEADGEGPEVLIDTVAEVRRLDPTKLLLTLQSGQVWRQSVGKNYLIRPGDKVRISGSSWGSDFRLSVDGRRGYIQVTRQE